MTATRTWAWFAVGTIGAASGAAGTYAWLQHRSRRRGKIHKIGSEYLVQSLVAEELAARVPGSRAREGHIVIPLGYRGTLILDRAPEDAGPLGELYRIVLNSSPQGPGEAIENILTEFVSYGLAVPGERFPAWRDVRSPGQPLALNFKAPVRESDLPQQGRPHGHYFQVGDIYYADERMLETIEWIPGTEPDDKDRSVTVPLWKRGALHFALVTDHTLFPEQRGKLYRIEPRLVGVALDDLLVELLQLGVIGWGGEWDRLPTKIAEYPRTGTPPWIAAGHVAILAGEAYLDESVLGFLRTRLNTHASPDGLRASWRGREFQLRPLQGRLLRNQRGTLYHVGRARDPDVAALLFELVLRRIAGWSEQSDMTLGTGESPR